MVKWKGIEEGLDIKIREKWQKKYNSNHTKNRCELVEKPKKQFNRIFVDKILAIKLIMDCRITMGHKFRTRLRFKQ